MNKARHAFLLMLTAGAIAPLPAAAAGPAGPVAAAAVPGAVLEARVRALAAEASQRNAAGLRVEVRVGALDPRLKLAPCSDIRPYLPAGSKPWGATRVGLRCADAGVRWNVYLPVTVHVFGPGLIAATDLRAGTVLGAGDLQPGTVDLAAAPSPAIADAPQAVGRALARPIAAGTPLRAADLRPRQWFAAGDTVRITAGGSGWRIHGEGLALNPGVEGRIVRVRTESGRVVSGLATGERMVEVAL